MKDLIEKQSVRINTYELINIFTDEWMKNQMIAEGIIEGCIGICNLLNQSDNHVVNFLRSVLLIYYLNLSKLFVLLCGDF